MRKLILFSSLLLILSAFIHPEVSHKRAFSPQVFSDDLFILGAMDNYKDESYTYISDPDVFGMNIWHRFTSHYYDPVDQRHKPSGWTPEDLLETDYTVYGSGIKDILDDNANHNMKTLMNRPKIEWLCYGQRSDYQCEKVDYVDPYYWFYSFHTNYGRTEQDNSQYGDGQYVLFCSGSIMPEGESNYMSAGTVLKKLRCNNEQTKPGQGWRFDSESTWYVKPSIRIPNSFPINNPEDDVCSIKIYDPDGQLLIPEVVIKGKHFLNSESEYSGEYIEEFIFTPNQPPTGIEIQGSWGEAREWTSRGSWAGEETNKMDIQVYWYGNCDMWIDYIRVDNDVADRLLSGTDEVFEDWLEWEGDFIANHSAGGTQHRFYLEEIELNNVPCVAYVNQKLKEYTATDTVDLMINFHWGRFTNHHAYHDIINGDWGPGQPLDASVIHNTLMEPAGLREFFTVTYPYTANDTGQAVFSKVPNTLPTTSSSCIWADAVTPSEYEPWLQSLFDEDGYPNLGSMDFPEVTQRQWTDFGYFRWQMKMANEYSKTYNKPFLNMTQAHIWRYVANEIRREPTNEELMMAANLSLSYGSKGLMYFWYDAVGNSCTDNYFGKGYIEKDVNGNPTPRTENEYGQAKWDSLVSLHKKIRKWGPHLMKYDYDYTNSYAYYRSDDRSSLKSSTYISNIAAYPPIPSDLDEVSTTPDEESETYLQASVFKNDSANSQYMMITNRRCSPYRESINQNGGRRRIKIQFDNGAGAYTLNGFNNWKIIDLGNYTHVVTFDKNSTNYVDLGWFLPGEGRLYKLAPVMQEGGTFVTNESLGQDVICKDTVFNDGYNLTIPVGRAIEFKQNVKVVMEGGSFFSCLQGGTPTEDDVLLKGNGSDLWNGFQFTDCDTVKIDNTIIQNIENYDPPNTFYAFDVINCDYVKISESAFTGYNTGAVRCTYTSGTGVNILINANTFSMNNNHSPVIAVYGNSAITLPIVIDNNNFTVSSTSISQAVLVNNISGAVIKNNDITNYQQGILALSSSGDLYNNTITSSISGQSVFSSSSTLNMTSPGKTITGGWNTINNSNVTAHNLEASDGLFYLDGGINTFLIPSNYTSGKHMYRYFPGSSDGSYPAGNNCYKYGSTVGAIHSVTWGSGGSAVSFDFNYNCGQGQGSGMSSKSEGQMENFILVPVTDEYNDTLFLLDSGVNSMYDSMFVEMRLRNYARVAEIAEDILSNEPESEYAPDAVHKLYLASLSLDSAGDRMSPLKSFLEGVILDNGDKPELVKKAFYFIQKCKSALGDYSSAMAGFEDIMNNYPNTYDALIASWDYSATVLLLNGGSSGGNRNAVSIINYQSSMYNKESIEKLYELKSFEDDPKDVKDRSNLSKEQKQVVKQNVVTTFENERKKTIDKVNTLEERSAKGDRNAKRELKTIKNLQATIQKRQPENIQEHIQNVSSDITKIFNSEPGDNIIEQQNTIPTEYELSQNFPNPFNPTTKIQFALPTDGKVQLVIYDILGREVAKLLNNEFRTAGRYVSEFNGSRLASGIYFYRISVDEGKAFNQVKKMVLLK